LSALQPFAAHAAATPDRAALIAADGEELSYGALDRWGASLAATYRDAGVQPGMRVLVALGMSPALYAVLIALWRVGAVAVFPEPSAGLAGLRHAVAVTQPKRFVGGGRIGMITALLAARPALARPLPVRRGAEAAGCPTWPDAHPALISFTSGSTGRPKGILRTHGFLLAQQRALTPLLRTDGPVRDLVCLPLFVLAGLGLGTTSAIPDADLRRPAEADATRLSAQIVRDRLTRLLAPPSIAGALAAQPAYARMRHVFTGGGPVWPDVIRRLVSGAPDAAVTAVYGSTEAEPVAHQALHDLRAADWAAMEGGGGLLAGMPVSDVALRIVDTEIQVAGAHVNRGYLDPSQDAGNKVLEGGTVWHRTGDAGRLDGDGRVWLLGRLEGRAGPWFPFAVEVAARGWPGVRQAALIEDGGRIQLAIAGDAGCEAVWRHRAGAFAGIEVRTLPALPLDHRHQAKTDYGRLRQVLRR